MKKVLFALIVLLVLIGIFSIVFKSCLQTTPKEETTTTEETTVTENSSETEPPSTDSQTPMTDDFYLSAFIQASIELSCYLDANPEVKSNQPELKSQAYGFYQKHNLPVDDNSLMIQILNRYEKDESVLAEIKKGNGECR